MATDQPFKPGINIPKAGLASFQAYHAGDDRSVHLTTDAGDQLIAHLFVGTAMMSQVEVPITRTKSPGLTLHGTHVTVESTHCNRYICGESQSVSPLFGEVTHHGVARWVLRYRRER